MIKFLKKEGNRRLILIFTGWGTGPELYKDVEIPGWDVAVVFRIDSKPIDFSKFHGYYTIYLFAWSLGVYMADLKLPADRITKAFAINGTVAPVHDSYGIPVKVFRGTADNLNPRNLTKFRRRTMPDSQTFARLFPEEASRMMCSCLAAQLYDVMEIRNPGECAPRLQWTRAYIGSGDRIFPPENLEAAWKLDPEVEIVRTDDAHFMDIPAIIRSVIADTCKVSSRFSKAAGTYDSHAIPQRMIALHLASLLKGSVDRTRIHRILEIGPGTGFLTRSWSKFLTPEHTDFVDITSAGPFPIPGIAAYHVADAEAWTANQALQKAGCGNKYDLIVSSSVIQWFADIPRFINNCADILHVGGCLALSTFLPGNLCELDALRPAPLLYPSVEELKNALSVDFDILIFDTSTIRMEFESRRHLLLHLKNTGVGGSAATKITPSSPLTSLTYRPVFCIAIKTD